ncbi:MAG: hypothetical protein K2X48_07605 [Chitinophagaceae bacterium]|nr:hypothetical protein [Chitinophagaceae bacterium]
MINTRYLFLDANVYDRYIFHLRTGLLLNLIATHLPGIHIIVCSELFTEIRTVCNRPGKPFELMKSKGLADVNAAVEKEISIIKLFAGIDITDTIPITEQQPKADPKDWYIHNLGKQYNVTIVSNDTHLIQLKNKPYPFFTADEFLNQLKAL